MTFTFQPYAMTSLEKDGDILGEKLTEWVRNKRPPCYRRYYTMRVLMIILNFMWHFIYIYIFKGVQWTIWHYPRQTTLWSNVHQGHWHQNWNTQSKSVWIQALEKYMGCILPLMTLAYPLVPLLTRVIWKGTPATRDGQSPLWPKVTFVGVERVVMQCDRKVTS